MQEKRKGGTVTLQVTCAVLFILFVVSYVFLFQCDVLAMSQYAWSDGQKHYERIIQFMLGSYCIFAYHKSN